MSHKHSAGRLRGVLHDPRCFSHYLACETKAAAEAFESRSAGSGCC